MLHMRRTFEEQTNGNRNRYNGVRYIMMKRMKSKSATLRFLLSKVEL